MASDLALALSLNFYQVCEKHSPLPSDSLITYLMQLTYCQRLFKRLSLTASQEVEVNHRALLLNLPQAWYWWESVLACSLALPNPLQTQERQPQTVDHFTAANR